MSTTLTNAFQSQGYVIQPTSAVSWADLGSSPYTSWSNWTLWNPQPNTATVEILEDTGASAPRLPILPLQYQGTITVSLDISDSLDSAGDLVSPTTINFVEGTEYAPVSGRYYKYTITLDTDSTTPSPYVILPTILFNDDKITDVREDIDTSTLSGTIDARQLTTTVGIITSLTATALQGGVTYSSQLLQDRVYAVPDDYTFDDNAIVINTVSKSPPVIRCFDLNGESIDAIIDVTITGLPKIQLTEQGVLISG